MTLYWAGNSYWLNRKKKAILKSCFYLTACSNWSDWSSESDSVLRFITIEIKPINLSVPAWNSSNPSKAVYSSNFLEIVIAFPLLKLLFDWAVASFPYLTETVYYFSLIYPLLLRTDIFILFHYSECSEWLNQHCISATILSGGSLEITKYCFKHVNLKLS